MSEEIKVGVVALITNSAGDILLGLKGRACKPEFENKWVVPGGRINFGEHAEDAIQREVFEEVGLRAQILRQLPSREIIHADIHFVFLVYEMLAIGEPVAGDDLRQAKWCTRSEAITLVGSMTPITREILGF